MAIRERTIVEERGDNRLDRGFDYVAQSNHVLRSVATVVDVVEPKVERASIWSWFFRANRF